MDRSFSCALRILSISIFGEAPLSQLRTLPREQICRSAKTQSGMGVEEEAKASDLYVKGMNSWEGSARSKIRVAYGSTSILTCIFPIRPTHFFPTETRHVYNEHLWIIMSPRSSMTEVILSRPPSFRSRQANKGSYGSVPCITNSTLLSVPAIP